MSYPKTFFVMNDAYVRISEIACIRRPEGDLRVILKNGDIWHHKDYNGSAAKMTRRLLDAITAAEG